MRAFTFIFGVVTALTLSSVLAIPSSAGDLAVQAIEHSEYSIAPALLPSARAELPAAYASPAAAIVRARPLSLTSFSLISIAQADEPAPSPVLSVGPQVPDVDLGVALGQLFSIGKLGVLGGGMAIIVFLVQALKLFPGFKYYRLTTVGLASVYGVLAGLSTGMSAGAVIVMVLFTGGGAVAIYEALKGAGILKSAAA